MTDKPDRVGDVMERVAAAMIEPLGYVGKSLADAESIWVGNNIDDAETGSLAYLCRSLARAALEALGQHSEGDVERGDGILDLTKPVASQSNAELASTLEMHSDWACLREIGEGPEIRAAQQEAAARLRSTPDAAMVERQELYDTVNDWLAGHGCLTTDESIDKLLEALGQHSEGDEAWDDAVNEFLEQALSGKDALAAVKAIVAKAPR